MTETFVSSGNETSGNMAISPVAGAGSHAACDAEMARLQARAEAAEARLAEILQCITTFTRHRVCGTDTLEALEGIRQICERTSVP